MRECYICGRESSSRSKKEIFFCTNLYRPCKEIYRMIKKGCPNDKGELKVLKFRSIEVSTCCSSADVMVIAVQCKKCNDVFIVTDHDYCISV